MADMLLTNCYQKPPGVSSTRDYSKNKPRVRWNSELADEVLVGLDGSDCGRGLERSPCWYDCHTWRVSREATETPGVTCGVA
jgi:hypothetical protein